jgi:hypothetical protein
MTNTGTVSSTTVLSLRCEEQVYPPHDALHGTPHAMLLRRLRIVTTRGSAVFEQTDYGHPGRLNPWDPRGIDSRLQSQTEQLRTLANAVSAILD